MDNTNDISRRDFIQRISLLGAISVGAGSVLSACGGGETDTGSTDTGDQADAGGDTGADTGADAGGGGDDAFTCTDTSGLTEAEIQTRESLQYVDATPEEGKTCSGCALFVAVEEGQQCGGCTLLKGPIHPDGYCISWVEKPA